MWVNLHSIPVGQSMYTLYLTADPVGTPRDQVCAEEVDVITSSRATVAEVVEAAREEIDASYSSSMRIIGVSNESDAYIMADVLETGDLR
jgi:hypothetical protein